MVTALFLLIWLLGAAAAQASSAGRFWSLDVLQVVLSEEPV